MADARNQFTFYLSFRESIKRIRKAADRALAYDIICDFALYGVEPDLDALPDAVAIAYLSARPNLIASAKRAESGSKGGTSGKQNASKAEANNKQTQAKRKGERGKTAREIEKEKEIEIENEIENDNNSFYLSEKESEKKDAADALAAARADEEHWVTGIATLKRYGASADSPTARNFVAKAEAAGFAVDFEAGTVRREDDG